MPGFIQSISIMLEKFVDKHQATMRKKGWVAGRQTARNYFAEVNVIDVEMEVVLGVGVGEGRSSASKWTLWSL